MSGKCKGQTKNSYRILIRKPEGKRPLGKSRPKWADKSKVDFKVIGCKCRWIPSSLARD
jgi:hypothetical protein